MRGRFKTSDFFTRRLDERFKGQPKPGEIEFIKNQRIYAERRAKFFAGFSRDMLESMRSETSGKVIFLGQGMRPLYETMKKINKALKVVSPRRIRYFIYSSDFRGKPHYKEGEAVDALISTGIADTRTRNFTVIDYDVRGHVSRFIKELRMASEKAAGGKPLAGLNITNLDGKTRYSAIDLSEGVLRPVRTSAFEKKGVKMIGPDRAKRKQDASLIYLFMEEAIQREVERAKTSTT